MAKDFTCPSCGFLVFDEEPGSYDICPLCDWEDDHVQLRYPAMSRGANSVALYESQRRALEKYPSKVSEVDGLRRDPTWRPLNESEILAPRPQPRSSREYFDAAGEDSPPYYWRFQADYLDGQE